MIVDIHYKIQHFDCRADERVCFMCAVQAAVLSSSKKIRVKMKSGRKPVKCDHCDSFVHDTIDTGEEPKGDCCGGGDSCKGDGSCGKCGGTQK